MPGTRGTPVGGLHPGRDPGPPPRYHVRRSRRPGPLPAGREAPRPGGLLSARIRELCSSPGCSYLDLSPPPRPSRVDNRKLYIPTDGHLDTEGHAAAAAAITGWLRAQTPDETRRPAGDESARLRMESPFKRTHADSEAIHFARFTAVPTLRRWARRAPRGGALLGGAGDVQVGPRRVPGELTDEPGAGDRAGSPAPAKPGLRSRWDQLPVFPEERHWPVLLPGGRRRRARLRSARRPCRRGRWRRGRGR